MTNKKINLYAGIGIGIGLILILLTAAWLHSSSLAVGIHTISLFIFLFTNVTFACLIFYQTPLKKNHIILLILILLITATPFIPYIGSDVEFMPEDDVARYYSYAQNMIESGTLWGSDALIYEGQSHFVDQPGYRYLLAASLSISSEPNRGLQLIHILLYWIATIWFLYAISRTLVLQDWQKNLVILFVLFSIPFATKAILLGISEWIAAALSMVGFAFIIRKSYWLAIVVFSLIPFFRQNLFIAVIFLISWIVFVHISTNRQKLLCGLSAVIILLLPLWHNLYFAGEMRLLVTNTAIPLEYTTENIKPIFSRVLQRFAHYAGITFESTSYSSIVSGLMMLPLGSFLVIYLANTFSNQTKLFYVLLIICTITPTLILGWAYYPRFEYLNLWFLICAGLILHKKKEVKWSTLIPNKLSH